MEGRAASDRTGRSSYFDDRSLFPAGSIEFDLRRSMRGVAHGWRAQRDLRCPASSGTVAECAIASSFLRENQLD